jgi:hypothetical protein
MATICDEAAAWRDVWRRSEAWRASQPWAGWSLMPPGAEREEKRLLFLEAAVQCERAAEDAVGEHLASTRRAREADLWEAQMARRGVPRRVWSALESPNETKACSAVARFLGGPTWFLVLAGGVGSGKTTAAALAVVSEKGRMVTATETADHLFDRPWWDDLEAYPLVVIDDLGTEKADGEGYWVARWRAVLDARYRHSRRLIVTCNLPRDVFLARYVEGDGGRTLDRMRDGGTWSTCAGDSMRLTNVERTDDDSLDSTAA